MSSSTSILKPGKGAVKPSVFDQADILYLVKHFTAEELQEEAERADAKAMCAKVREFYRGTPEDDGEDIDNFPWKEFAAACRQAARLRESSARKKTARSGGRWLDVEDIKARADIVEIAGRYTELKKKGRNFSGLCPVHTETGPSFYVYPEQQRWHCYGCNAGGDVIALVMAVEKCDFQEALRCLA